MSKFVFIESTDPSVSVKSSKNYDLMEQLLQEGCDVVVYLLENAVFISRQKHKNLCLSNLLKYQSLRVYVDDVSMKERGIRVEEMDDRVGVGEMDSLLDIVMEDERKAIWH